MRAVSSGFSGGPGLSTFYFGVAVPPFNTAAAQLAVNRVRDAYTAGKTNWWNTWSLAVSGQVDGIDEDTGLQVDAWAVTGATVPGDTVPSTWGPAPCGAETVWVTGDFVNGKAVKGRTYHVPIALAAFEGNGTLTTLAISRFQSLNDAMLSAGATDCVFGVYSRPFAGRTASPGKPAIPARLGSFHGASGGTTPDKVVVLRSRRD